jgi:hypothetical protein
MKKLLNTGPIGLRSVIGNLLTNRRILLILAVSAGLLISLPVFAYAPTQPNVYFYNYIGAHAAADGNSNAASEEWAAPKSPDGSSMLLLLGLALLPLGLLRARREASDYSSVN